jgi:hypothetical protein
MGYTIRLYLFTEYNNGIIITANDHVRLCIKLWAPTIHSTATYMISSL